MITITGTTRGAQVNDNPAQAASMNVHRKLLFAFYGDDFTGSTDALEALSVAGVRTALFFEPPTPDEMHGKYSDLQAVGVAGVSRSLTPEGMEAVLPAVFKGIKRLDARLFHYKVCSTFDSAPEVGSIGRAIDLGQRIFKSSFVPLVVGAPALKRYTVFGNHFATVDLETFRLDRHPTMSRHPTTPMGESDLRRHLAAQTNKPIALMDILHLSGAPDLVDARLTKVLEAKPEVVLFDVLDDARLAEVGRLMWMQRQSGVRFVVGSSGIEYALAAHWRATGTIAEHAEFKAPAVVEQLIVVSGSCSPVTKLQIDRALAQGFVGIAIDVSKLIEAPEREREFIVRQALSEIALNRSVIIHSAYGADDPRIKTTTEALRTRGFEAQAAAEIIGTHLGIILRTLIERTRMPRVVVAGGDTSGYVARELGVAALEMVAPLSPGAPLCQAGLLKSLSGTIEIALKGGQLGSADFFERARRGS